MSPFPANIDGSRCRGYVETTHRVIRFKQYLHAGVLPDGAVRTSDLIQFWTDPGGLRTVRAEDIVL